MLQQVPKPVWDLVREIEAQFGNDVALVIREANRQVKLLPNYEGVLKDQLANLAIQEMCYRVRCAENKEQQRVSRNGHSEPKIIVGNSATVNKVCAKVYAMRIGGTLLGNILGKDIPMISARVRSQGLGRLLQADLLDRLTPLVAKDKKVQECITPKKLKKICDDVLGNHAPEFDPDAYSEAGQ